MLQKMWRKHSEWRKDSLIDRSQEKASNYISNHNRDIDCRKKHVAFEKLLRDRNIEEDHREQKKGVATRSI